MPRGYRGKRRGRRKRRSQALFKPTFQESAPGGGLPTGEEVAGWKAADTSRQQREGLQRFREAERQPWVRPNIPEPGTMPAPKPTPSPFQSGGPRAVQPEPTATPSAESIYRGEHLGVPQVDPQDLPPWHPERRRWLHEQRRLFLENQARNAPKLFMPVPTPGWRDTYDYQQYGRQVMPPGWQSDTGQPVFEPPWAPAGGWEAYPSPQADPYWYRAPQGGTY